MLTGIVDVGLKSGGESSGSPDKYIVLKDYISDFVKRGLSVSLSMSAPALTRAHPLYTGDRSQDRVTQLLENALETGETKRLQLIYSELNSLRLSFDQGMFMAEIGELMSQKKRDELLAQGERWNAILFSRFLEISGLNVKLIHGDDAISLRNGVPIGVNTELFKGADVYITSGFHGRNQQGEIELLPFGGTDITGDTLAAALRVGVYEVLKEIDGIYSADPEPLKNYGSSPNYLEEITFAEVRELAYGGARVLQANAMERCRQAGIPIVVKSLNSQRSGTRIGGNRLSRKPGEAIAGIATKPGFVLYTFPRKHKEHYLTDVLNAVVSQGISFDMISTDRGKFHLAIHGDEFGPGQGKLDTMLRLYQEINLVTKELEERTNISLVSVVGEGIEEPRPFKAMLTNELMKDGLSTYASFGALLWEPGHTVVDISKFGMHGERGYGKRVANVFESLGAKITLASTTIDTISFGTNKVIDAHLLERELNDVVDYDSISITRDGLLLYGPSRRLRNLSFAVGDSHRHKAVSILHDKIFGKN
jgi:aspartate kinase